MSNQVVNGVVGRTWTKQKSTRYGDKNLHYCEVDGVTFSTGFKKVFSDGEMVNAVVKFNYGELQYQPDVTAANGMAPATNAAPATKGNFTPKGGSNYSKGKFPVDKSDGQMSIIRQSSMNRAVEIMSTLLDKEIIAVDSDEAYMKKLIEIAYVVCEFGSGQDMVAE